MEQVEPETWHHSSMEVNDEHHPSNLSSTPPILRRRGRKRDAEEERLDQVIGIISSGVVVIMANRSGG